MYMKNRSGLTDIENKCVVTKRVKRRGKNWGHGINIYKLLCIK